MYPQITSYFRDLGNQIGVEFYLVGGAVRDIVGELGTPSDYDLVARNLPAEELVKALAKHGQAEITGTHFEVIRFRPNDRRFHAFEIALPRTEVSTGPSTNDFEVVHDHTLSIEVDLWRRDFTVNAMAINLHTQEFHDPTGGRVDLADCRLRAVSSETIREDPLRIIRALRFIAKLGLTVDMDTRYEIEQNLHLLAHVSKERFQKELLELVMGKYADQAFEYARDTGALGYFLPELLACDGCMQNKWHSFDVFKHSMAVLVNTHTDDPYVKLAALMHDFGKPVVRWVDRAVDPTGNPHFYQHEDVVGSRDHEDVSAELAYSIMRRFKFSNQHADRVAGLCREHMFAQGPNLRRPSARRLLARLEHLPGGLEANVEALFAIRYGDCRGGKNYAEGSMEALDLEQAISMNERFQALVLGELEADSAFTVRDLAVNGHDLMAEGLTGVDIGIVQKELLEAVIDSPELNNKENLLELVRGRLL